MSIKKMSIKTEEDLEEAFEEIKKGVKVPKIPREDGIEKLCPRCDKTYMEYSAISRRDNKTKICPDCGRDEALFDLGGSDEPYPEEVIRKERAWLLKLGKDKTSGSGGFKI